MTVRLCLCATWISCTQQSSCLGTKGAINVSCLTFKSSLTFRKCNSLYYFIYFSLLFQGDTNDSSSVTSLQLSNKWCFLDCKSSWVLLGYLWLYKLPCIIAEVQDLCPTSKLWHFWNNIKSSKINQLCLSVCSSLWLVFNCL